MKATLKKYRIWYFSPFGLAYTCKSAKDKTDLKTRLSQKILDNLTKIEIIS